MRVELAPLDSHQVSGLPGLDLRVDTDPAELAPQRRNTDLDLRARRGRRFAFPHQIDELIHAHDSIGFEQESAQDRLLATGGDLDLLLRSDHLDRAE